MEASVPIDEVTLSEEDQEVLMELGTPAVWRRLASYPGLSERFQVRMLKSKDPLVKEALATNPGLAPKVQRRLLASDAGTRTWLASNPSLTEYSQTTLAEDVSVDVRRMLAMNPSLMHDVQVLLTRDVDSKTRTHLASRLTAHLTRRMGARFLYENHPLWFDQKVSGIDGSTLHSLLATWEGSLKDLVRAVENPTAKPRRFSLRRLKR